jgi:hypothetical protein
MRKECAVCRSVTNSDAPYCEACGCDFGKVPALVKQGPSWLGRILIALAVGLLAAGIINALHK